VEVNKAVEANNSRSAPGRRFALHRCIRNEFRMSAAERSTGSFAPSAAVHRNKDKHRRLTHFTFCAIYALSLSAGNKNAQIL
jgi:hypothetical protein